MTSMAKQEVDKKMLYGKFQDAEDRRAKFAERIAHKAADMAMMDDDMNIVTTKTGISTPGAVGIAGILAAAGLGYGYLTKPAPAPVQPPAVVQHSTDERDFVVKFYNRKGEVIDVDRLPPELRKAAQ